MPSTRLDFFAYGSHADSSRSNLYSPRTRAVALLVIIVLGGTPAAIFSQAVEEPSAYESLAERLEAQERQLAELRERLDSQQPQPWTTAGVDTGPDCAANPEIIRLPVVVETEIEPSCSAESPAESHVMRYYADYDNGFVIRPFDSAKHPFELQVNGWIQFRHDAFAREVDSWTDNAGVTRPVRNRNNFDIERGRLVFSGHALSPKLIYFLQLDGDTDGAEMVDFFDYWWGWKFSDAFELQMGKRKVPGSRQWLLTARRTRLVDRPMADDFFRPDRTQGLFAVGNLGESNHYELMVGDGYHTSNLPPTEFDNNFALAATHYCDPLGDFGEYPVAFDESTQLLARIGHSFTYAKQDALSEGIPLSEADFVRLTDGTQLTEVGALAPGAKVTDYNIYLYGIDLAAKWRGWSVNAEIFFRWLADIQGDAPLPVADLMQRGFYVEGGKFLIPQRFDVNFRYSLVSGLFGNGFEYAGGFNWYPLETLKMKISFDVTAINSSPLNNTTTDILVGDTGTLFRTQFQAEF